MADAFDPDKYLAEKTAVAQNAQAFDPDAYLKEKTGVGAEEPQPGLIKRSITDFMQSHPNVAKVASGVGRVLDYPGGLLRTGLASAGGLITGQPNVVNDTDVANAFKGQAPSSAEYLERLGTTPGPTVLDNSITGKISARDLEGFGLDVATDPLTALSKAGKIGAPVGDALENAGKSAYKSGFKNIDERLLEKGKTPLSDILLENGAPTGTTKKIAGNVSDLTDKFGQKRASLYQQATDAGASVDLGYPLARTEGVLNDMRANPGLRDAADKLEAFANEYKKEGKVDVGQLSDWKSNLYDALPESSFGPHGPKNYAQKFKQALAGDFKNSIEDAGNTARPGLGDEIGDTNNTLGSLLSAKDPLNLQIRRGTTPNMITPIDAALAVMHPYAEGAKKAADLAKTTWLRTNLGKGLMNAGESGIPDAVTRQGLIDLEEKKRRGLLDGKGPEIRVTN